MKLQCISDPVSNIKPWLPGLSKEAEYNLFSGYLLNPYRFIQDQYWNQVVLLLLCNGTNGGSAIIDSSSFARSPITVGGARTRTANKVEGTAALADEGTVPTWADSTDFRFSNGQDFTIEMYAYPAFSQASYYLIAKQNGASAGRFGIGHSGTKLAVYQNGSAVVTGSDAITAVTWNHIAYSRSGTTGRLFRDGVLKATDAADTRNYTDTSSLSLFGDTTGANSTPANTLIDMLRITRAARYTSAFTPPTSYPLSGG